MIGCHGHFTVWRKFNDPNGKKRIKVLYLGKDRKGHAFYIKSKSMLLHQENFKKMHNLVLKREGFEYNLN